MKDELIKLLEDCRFLINCESIRKETKETEDKRILDMTDRVKKCKIIEWENKIPME